MTFAGAVRSGLSHVLAGRDSAYSASSSLSLMRAMVSRSDVRRIALSLPQTREGDGHFAFSVRNGAKDKGFCWVWMERVVPTRPRIPNPDVLAVRVADLGTKELLLMAAPEKFFDEAHYAGFPAVLVRLKAISRGELRSLLADAWATQAPKRLLAATRKKHRRL